MRDDVARREQVRDELDVVVKVQRAPLLKRVHVPREVEGLGRGFPHGTRHLVPHHLLVRLLGMRVHGQLRGAATSAVAVAVVVLVCHGTGCCWAGVELVC